MDRDKLESLHQYDITKLIKELEIYSFLDSMPTNNSFLSDDDNVKKLAADFTRMMHRNTFKAKLTEQ